MTRFICICSILFLLFATVLTGGTTGKITGRIVDSGSGDPLIGANVIIQGTSMGAASDRNGNFLILNVPPGTYTLFISMMGYKPQRITDVRVQIDLTSRVDVQLEMTVVELGEAVTVVAERRLVQKDLTSSEARISTDEIDIMPVTEMYQILQLQGGVTLDAGGGIHIRGGRSSEIAYWVDGVPITDAYDMSQSVSVENEAIQELQVISGTYNAEYGNAMSGIINIVTKEGGREFHGSISGYGGDYFTTDNNLYPGIDRINPLSEKNVQVNFSGPVPGLMKVANFYTTARYNYTDGWLYGKSYFNIYGDTLDHVDYVPMNWRKKLTTQSKLSLRISPKIKARFSLITSDEAWEDFDHGLQLVPDANIEKNSLGRDLALGLTHTLSEKTFYELNAASYSKYFYMWLFKDENDPRYIDPYYWEHVSRINPDYWFTDHAINTSRFWRKTNTEMIKLDVTSQITQVHLIKFGLEAKEHRLELDGYSIIDDPSARDTVFTPYIPGRDEFGRGYYLERPREFSAYIQDKIEYRDMIINFGVRYDYFDANSKIPANPNDPYIMNPRDPALDTLSLEEREAFWWKKTTSKHQVSPRLGISYPITDRGVIHFSFGHFFQIPQFELLYTNPGYKIPESSGMFGPYRNPDLKPQRTVMYELGLRQEITADMVVDLTGFYRDVRDWVSTGIPIELGGGATYSVFVNKDYSNVRGIVLSVTKRYSGYNQFSLNYTYQVAEGSNSDPGDEFGALQANREPRRYIVPLNWDQRHTLNGSLFFGTARGGLTLIGSLGSGYPYTPAITVSSRMGRNVSTQLESNSRRKPVTYDVDLKLFRNVNIKRFQITIFMDIYNLFDTRNELIVYGNTGRANKSLDEPTPEEAKLYESPYRINSIHDVFVHQEWYSEPRKIQFGFNFSW